MPQLTPQGQQVVHDLSVRTGFSEEAVTYMLIAVLNGNGSMAQFSHAEFGGSGQWMRGGMTMVGDMFNNHLKGRVDGLCSEIAALLASQPGLFQVGSFQSQSQGGGPGDMTGPLGASPFFVPDARTQWYPQELGVPTSSGSQNSTRYAYFGNQHRLAVDTGGDVWVYDTLNHQIGGFAQQQGGSTSLTFTSQQGPVNVATLPVVFRNGRPVTPVTPVTPAPASAPSPARFAPLGSPADIYEAIEQLTNLKAKGILTEQEYAAKKAELLARI
jgi:hypothetical protein